jgi:magnesium chelatase family protein
MSVATTKTISLQGAVGHLIDVQADISHGLIRTAVVGRPDASINEARDRVRSSLDNLDEPKHRWPTSRRVTILLSPADLPKSGPHFDLAIAVSVLCAMGVVPQKLLRDLCLIGELTLDGRLRAVPGVLAMAMAAKKAGYTTLVVPEPQIGEATLVPGVTAYGVRSLPQVLAMLRGDEVPEAEPVPPLGSSPLLSWRGERSETDVDLADVRGMADARFALEVAAAGGHHVMLSGPKGSGKTTLAERVPGLLPDLDLEESLELTAVHSLAGEMVDATNRIVRPPYRAPHHSITRTALLGGGTGRVRPGEVSKAHLGALFLDEFPHFPSDVIEALREPLENGEVTLARGEETATFPARTMFVFACNPCPCGEYRPTNRDNPCECSEISRRTYRRKITGPIADRIDILRHVQPVTGPEAADPVSRPETSAQVRARVVAARSRQAARLEGTPWRLNSDIPGPRLREQWALTRDAEKRLDQEIYTGRLTRRGGTRVHRLAWTVADLRGVDHPGLPELEIALRLRSGEPLDLAMLPLGGAA